jgi:hypothetical protein
MKIAFWITMAATAALFALGMSSCSIIVRPDGSKEVNVDAATFAGVAKIVAEK